MLRVFENETHRSSKMAKNEMFFNFLFASKLCMSLCFF